MLTVTILILFIVILMVRTPAASTFFTDPSSTSGGLNLSVIKALPIFTFSTATAQNAMGCSICLSEFKDNESGRVLRNSKHTFHVDCIDMSVHSHSFCPLCRSLIEPFVGGVKSTMHEVLFRFLTRFTVTRTITKELRLSVIRFVKIPRENRR
ncbi:putative transcription factor C2H2 family [Arabidopsis thaliana]